MSRAISYSQLDKTLRKLGAHLNAAETHGLLTGILSMEDLSANEEVFRKTVLQNLDCVAKPSKSQWHILEATGSQITAELSSLDCDFNMLLPNDHSALTERIDALGFWCRGYLSGLGLAGITPEHLSNDSIKELVHDLSQIAHASIEIDASEEDEANYIELVEFVRIAVQNIRIELNITDSRRILH